MPLTVSITEVPTLASPTLLVVKVVADEGGLLVPILAFDQATKQVTSTILTARMLQIIQQRLDQLLVPAVVDPADIPSLASVIAGQVVVSDLTGTISPVLGTASGIVTVSLTGYGVGNTYTCIAIPHSIAPTISSPQ
jgi:hypothetical protein